MVVENFVQIPNKMFVDTNNDEKLVYVKLLQSQMVGYLDKDNRTTMTTVPVLVTLLGWNKSQYSNKKVITALNGLKEKYYINFESTKDVFVVGINKWNDKEKYELDVDWRESNVTFSGHTQIKYSVIDNLLEGKDFTIYSYTEYRTMKTHQYRICYEEWGMVLGLSKSNAFKNVNDSEVIVKVSHGYNKNTKKRETNSYLTFDKAELVEETAKKPTYEAQDESEKVSEPVVDDVSETKDYDVADEKVEETVAETISDEDIKDIKEQWKKITGNTREQNILNKMNDKRVYTIEHMKQIQDFNYPMSLEMYKVIQDTDDYYIRKYGKKKLASKLFKDNHADKLNAEIHKENIKKQEDAEKNKYRFKKFLLKYSNGKTQWLDFETFSDWKKMKLIQGDDDYGYGFTSAMVDDEGQGGIVKVLSYNEAMKFVD
ncbi:hypothetical protein [Lactococcus garvieae]|uniref:hypothetical protein n=1 Tax=Lactococcus garvieae TaxID=1363 RepID=UPI0018D9F5D3|nr:hypothetical protein [Lactococcus garvieae]QPS71409.1 hypothetical protein I6G50_01740 [Lactococcus garvieae]